MLYFEQYATVGDVIYLKKNEDPDRSDILKVPQTASLMDLIVYMNDHRVGVAFLFDGKKEIVGLISERDIIRHIANNHFKAFEMPIERLACRNIFSCTLSDKLKKVTAEMADRHIRHVAVKNEKGDYIGVVSSSDIELFAGQG